MSVRTYRISDEEWQAGSFQVCALCERPIRYVTEIDGRTYGCKCAEKVMASRGEQKPSFETVIPQETVNRTVHWLVKADLQARRNEELVAIAKKYFKQPNQVYSMLKRPVKDLEEVYDRCVSHDSPSAEGYRALLELKKGA